MKSRSRSWLAMPMPGVGDGEPDLEAPVSSDRERAPLALSRRGELDGVAQQVEQHLAGAVLVADHRLRRALGDRGAERQPLPTRQRSR